MTTQRINEKELPVDRDGYVDWPRANEAQRQAEALRLREGAKTSQQKEEESFQRSDTDGFLSQWAHGIGARLDNARAEILESGGTAEFSRLFEDDREVPCREIEGRWGWSWMLLDDDDVAKFGRKFIPRGSKSRVQKQLGLCEKLVSKRAWAKIHSSGSGLASCASATIAVFPCDQES